MTAGNIPLSGSPLPDHWLAFRLGHLGDVALTTGVLAHFARTRGWRFAVATRSAFAPVFDGIAHVERVFALNAEDLNSTGFLACSRRMAGALPGWGLLDLHASTRSRALGLLWPGTVARYPKMGLARRAFLASRGKLFKDSLNALSVPQRYAMALEDSPPPASALLPRIVLADAERAEADALLASLFPPACPDKGPARPVALHPFATHVLKTWPADHWRRLAALLDREGLPWVSIGVGKPLFAEKKQDLTGATTLRQSCSLLSRCRILVTGDSGPLHLATAVGTPVAAMFGPTSREWGFYPAGPFDTVLERPLACRPCSLHGGRPCPKNGECLSLISPEDVMVAIVRTPAWV